MVTGAAGFIGRHLTAHLAACGWNVRGLDVQAPSGPGGWIQADIGELERRPELLEEVDTVFHLASAHLQVGAPEGWYETVNVAGAEAVVRACAKSGVRRLVHTSSVGVYGHVESPPADEDAPIRPRNEYGRTKLRGEAAVLRAAAEEGVEVVVLRPAWVYGPGCRRTARLLEMVRRGRFAFVGDGSNLRHPVFVFDTLRAFVLAADAPAAAFGRPYIVAGPRAVTVRELVEAVARAQGVPAPKRRLPRALVRLGAIGAEIGFGLIGREPPVSRRSLAFFEHDNAFDGGAAERDLGFRPEVDLDEGLRLTVRGAARTSPSAETA